MAYASDNHRVEDRPPMAASIIGVLYISDAKLFGRRAAHTIQ